MTYSPATVANYFLDKALNESRAITPMQLIKLVYIAHGWHLGYLDKPLINEKVQAWKFGPVIGSLYHQVKQYGSKAVTSKISTMPWDGQPKIDNVTVALLDSVWNAYAKFSGLQLSTLTHQKGTPWDITWNERDGKSAKRAVIDDEVIRDHYRAKRQKAA